jgi:SnoaL-like domain
MGDGKTGRGARMDAVEAICSVEEIRQVKYRYLRCVDLKLWDELGDTLTEGAILDFGTTDFGGSLEIAGRSEIVAFNRAKFGPGTLTAHTAAQPEITVDGDTAAGVWSLRDTLLATRHGMIVTAAAFHYDRYERGPDGCWRIARSSYARSYEAMVSLSDLPSFKLIAALGGEPPEMAPAEAVAAWADAGPGGRPAADGRSAANGRPAASGRSTASGH